MPRATSIQAGGVVLRRGQEIRPIEIGILSEVGATVVSVHAKATVAVLSTGNELVSSDVFPSAGQIRNSNGPMLESLVQRPGGQPVNICIGRDSREELNELVARGLSQDVLVLSGGVSAGVLDLVPEALAANGVEQVFHKVHLKPGKPIWFGVTQDSDKPKLVFGLPGNPVSSLVCFELFVRPALRAIAGHQQTVLERRSELLAHDFQHRGDRPTYFPGRRLVNEGESVIELLAWKGSADLTTLAQADCLACLPPGARNFSCGEPIAVYLL